MSNAIESKCAETRAQTAPLSRSFGLPSLKWTGQYDRQRERVEQFISGVFQAGFQAKIMTYAPHLLYLETERRIQASLGLRHAADVALFCEAYLETDIISAIGTAKIARTDVYELSNLASMNPGSGAHLYILAAIALDMVGCKKLVFTANKAVRNSISKGGFTARLLASADVSRVSNSSDQWGTYYDSEPQVMVADIPESAAIIRANPQMMALVNLAQSELQDIANEWSSRGL